MLRDAVALWLAANARGLSKQIALGGPVDRDEQVEPAFLRSNLGNVDVEAASRIVGEPVRLRLVALELGKRPMPCRSRQRCHAEEADIVARPALSGESLMHLAF